MSQLSVIDNNNILIVCLLEFSFVLTMFVRKKLY